MKARHNDLIIDESEPFINCGLGRKKYAVILTDILKTYSESFVLALNGEWGTGKTTFIKMWKQHLEIQQFQTLYFNAWENDFKDDPIIPLLSELRSITNNSDDIYKKVLKNGAILAKNIAPTLINLLGQKYLGTESISDIIKKTSEGALEIFESEIKQFVEKKESLEDFKKELTNFIDKRESKYPIIFFIDELDRCRPNYAVEVLEQLKHFFSVQGIVFILSIDKGQLGNAIRGVYGSDRIDAEEYLRRFIDIEYSIPNPTIKDFTNYLFRYYSFQDFFNSKERNEYLDLRNDSENFLLMAEYIFSKENTSLRQQEKIFALTRLVLCFFKNNEFTFSHLLFLLVYFKIVRNNFYKEIEKGELTIQKLCDQISDWVFKEPAQINLGYIQALLLWFYNNNKEHPQRIVLLETDENGKPKTSLKSKILSNDDDLAYYFNQIDREKYSGLKLDFLINKINLTESVIIK